MQQLPVLTGVWIQAGSDGTVRVRATDLERDITTSFAADVATPGSTVAAGAELIQLLGSAPKGALRCAGDGHRFHVAWGRARFRLPAFHAEDYPDPPAVDEEGAADLPGETLTALAQVGFAASTDAARAVLQAVHVRSDAGTLTAITCNGMQVAKAVASASGWPEQAALVPAAGLALAARIFGAAENVRVAASDGTVQFSDGTVTLRLRLLEGRYPAVEDLLPKEYPTSVVIERGVLAGALERAAIVSHSAEQLHLVRLAVREDGLACRAETAEGGSGDEELEAAVSGTPIELGVNGQMLRDALRRLGGGTLRLELSGALTAMRLSGEDGPVYWQMPVRVG